MSKPLTAETEAKIKRDAGTWRRNYEDSCIGNLTDAYEAGAKPWAEMCEELERALEEILGCPRFIEGATVPSAGIDSAPPYQVVFTASIARTRIQNAEHSLSKLREFRSKP